MPTIVDCGQGRNGNYVWRAMAVSMIAAKHNLCVIYERQQLLEELGISCFSGAQDYPEKPAIELTCENFFEILQADAPIKQNLVTHDFYQTHEIAQSLHRECHTVKFRDYFLSRNPFREQDWSSTIFVHVRLGDILDFHGELPYEYYARAIGQASLHLSEAGAQLLISSDSPNHGLVKKLVQDASLPAKIFMEKDPVRVWQVASLARALVLSHGTFSTIMALLSTSDLIYFPSATGKWVGPIDDLPGVTKIPVTAAV